MDRNSIIGLVLIFLILIGFAWFNQPSEAELKARKQQQDSIALVQMKEDSAAKVMMAMKAAKDTTNAFDTLEAKQNYGTFATFSKGQEAYTTLENEELRIKIASKGGRIYSVELKNQKRFDKEPLILFTGDKNEFSYSFATADNKTIETKDLYFTPVASADGKSIAMQVKLADDQYIEQVYSLTDNNQMVGYKLNLVGMNKVIAPSNNHIALNWKQRMLNQEKNFDGEFRTTAVYYCYQEDVPKYAGETKDEKVELTQPTRWISFKQQYFNASIIADTKFDMGSVETVKDDSRQILKTSTATVNIPFAHNGSESFGMKFYFGPNHYKSLAKLDIQLERIIPMGWGIFRWVNKYFVINVFYFLSQYVGSFGLIILLLTVIIKTLLFPLVYRSYLSTAKMRVLKPELDEIKEKYGDDMTKTQQENMKLYRTVGVNPLGGCIPMVLQIPILFAMFQFFPSAFELRQQSFLWANDLSTYDSIYTLPFSIPGYGNHVSLFTILMTASSLFYTHYNNQMTAVTGQMKWLSYIMPVIFMFVLNSYPAGLNYYYFLSNLATISQQLAIRRFVDDKKIHAELQENKKKPAKVSKFQQKLEEMAKKRGVELPNQNKKK